MKRFAIAFFVLLSQATLAQQDIEGSNDHPLLTRFPGSHIVLYEFKNYDEFHWLTDEEIRLEGKVTRIAYSISKEHSTLEVYRSYERALQDGGFEILFSCQGEECPDVKTFLDLPGERPIGRYERFYPEGRRALAARRDGDRVFLLIYVGIKQNVIARLRIVEGERMQENLIRTDAATISKNIEESGSIALYDIFFDVDKAEIKSSSAPALTEIASYLKDNPAMKLYIVGHTDSTGSYSHNLGLSERRANAVVASLTSDHGIVGSRLAAVGLGPVAPVASNTTEEGRAQNRRVQLVAR